MDQDYTVFNYRTQILQKDLKYQFITIVAQPGMKPAPKFVLPGHRKEKTGKNPPPSPPRRVDHGYLENIVGHHSGYGLL